MTQVCTVCIDDFAAPYDWRNCASSTVGWPAPAQCRQETLELASKKNEETIILSHVVLLPEVLFSVPGAANWNRLSWRKSFSIFLTCADWMRPQVKMVWPFCGTMTRTGATGVTCCPWFLVVICHCGQSCFRTCFQLEISDLVTMTYDYLTIKNRPMMKVFCC